MYTGGIANLGAIKLALNIPDGRYLLFATVDTAIGALYLLFVLTLAPRLFGRFLPRFPDAFRGDVTTEMAREHYADLLFLRSLPGVLSALLAAGACVGLAVLLASMLHFAEPQIMRHNGMLPAKGIAKAKAASVLCASSKWLRSPVGGLIRIYKRRGDVVETGETLASISDPFGEAEATIAAPFGGIIIGRSVLPVVNEGDAVFHLAALKSNDYAEAAIGDLATQLEEDPLFDEDEII